MPLYEFDCPDCHTPFDKLVRSASAVAEVTCPTCGSGRVKKKLSTIAARPTGGDGASLSASAAACAPGGT